MNMKSALALLLTIALALPGCATARVADPRFPAVSDQRRPVDPQVMADYVRQLRIGSRVRLTRTNGEEIRGTLMKNDGDPLFVQRQARIPEAPVEVPLRDVLAVELDIPAKSHSGRNIAIGAAAAASATLGVLLILAMVFSD
jgi:hypothetical protein